MARPKRRSPAAPAPAEKDPPEAIPRRQMTYQTAWQLEVERAFEAAEAAVAASNPIDRRFDTMLLAALLAGLGYSGAMAVSGAEGAPGSGPFRGDNTRALSRLLGVLERSVADLRDDHDWNWLPFDDDEDNDAWELKHERFHPDEMIAEVRRWRRGLLAIRVMET